MKYKELFFNDNHIIAISFDHAGISFTRFQQVRKQLVFKKIMRIAQPELIQNDVSKGGMHLQVNAQSLNHLRSALREKLRGRVSIRVIIPQTCVFYRVLMRGEEECIPYILDTESPWSARQSMDRLVQDHDQATSLWAIPHAVQNIIDTFFRYRLDVEYDTLDVSLLAWMRFWIMQQHYPVQSYLPWFVQQQWPLVWYAPLIGALHADVDDEIC